MAAKANSDNRKKCWKDRSVTKLQIFHAVKLVEECSRSGHADALCTKSLPSGRVERPASTLALGCPRKPLAFSADAQLAGSTELEIDMSNRLGLGASRKIGKRCRPRGTAGAIGRCDGFGAFLAEFGGLRRTLSRRE